MSTSAIVFSTVVLALGTLHVPSIAKKEVVYVDAGKFAEHSAGMKQLGNYYVFQIDIPAALDAHVELVDAYLDLYVNAENAAPDELLGGLAKIEVYPLNGIDHGALGAQDLGRMVTRKSIPVGHNRFVRLHIMPFVDEVMRDPNKNHGLAVGALSGGRLGHFKVRQGRFGENYARVTFEYRDHKN